jgi:hypothetical protein
MEMSNLLVTNLDFLYVPIAGGCKIINWNPTHYTHKLCLLQSPNSSAHQTHTKPEKLNKASTTCFLLPCFLQAMLARSSEDSTESRNQRCSKYVDHTAIVTTLLEILRRPEPITVKNFVTSSLHLRTEFLACCTRCLSRVCVHEIFRRRECLVFYLRATYTPTHVYVQVEESFISAYCSNSVPEHHTHTHTHTQRGTNWPRGTPPWKQDKRTHLVMVLG